MVNMNKDNLSANYINDVLIEAKRVFQQAEYASILRGEVNASESEKAYARETLRLINWKNITYANVLIYTNEIEDREATAYFLLDKLAVAEKKLNEASNATQAIFSQAKIAFSEERYDDTENLLTELNIAIEKEKANASILSGIKNGTKNFFQRYWVYIIILLILFGIGVFLLYRIFEKRLLKNKIKKMRIEKKVLNDLMKELQIKRFKENSISGLVYNIRMNKYKERLQEIQEKLPVLEEKSKKI
jgi:hypothetical protein